MPTALKTKPGINGANILSIPTEWDATWFRKLINNSLKGADVRNAVGINGVTVTGNISSPYATISGGGSPFVAPITINSTAGQVSLTVNGASGQSAAVFNGPVVINDGFGPFGLTVNGTGTDVTLQLNTPSGRFSGLYMQRAGVTEAELFFDATVNDLTLSYDVAGSTFGLRGPAGVILTASATGDVVINASTGGSQTLLVDGTNNQDTVHVTGGATTGQSFGIFCQAGTNASDYALRCNNSTGAATLFIVRGNGSIQLSVGPVGELCTTLSALTNNAGASLGTISNAPAAGNPTKWIKINDGGTIRSIPAW